MIDIHTHLLPGVDDGSPTVEHSAMVMRRMLGEGTRGIVCTPHLDASKAAAAPMAEYRLLLEQLRAAAPPGITLYAGFEIMLDRIGTDLSAPALALGGSRARLVEFPRRGLPPTSTQELMRLKSIGVVPVVAHPERYLGCTLEIVRDWRDFGVVIQVDALALLSGGPMTEAARAMFADGAVDIMASDNHGDRRSLATARQWLAEIGAAEQGAVLTEENPRRLLADEPLTPVPPVRFERSVFDRLRDLLFNRRRRAPSTADET